MPQLQLTSLSALTRRRNTYHSLPRPYDSQDLHSVPNMCRVESGPNHNLRCHGVACPTHSRSLLELAHRLHRAHVKAILLDDLPVVKHVECLSGVLAREEHDGLLAARVVGEEVGHVID